MKNKEYNGWSNYETWNVSLWLNNEEGYYNMAQDLKWKAGEIEGLVTDIFNEFNGFGDLESSRELDKVDWNEIEKNNTD